LPELAGDAREDRKVLGCVRDAIVGPLAAVEPEERQPPPRRRLEHDLGLHVAEAGDVHSGEAVPDQVEVGVAAREEPRAGFPPGQAALEDEVGVCHGETRRAGEAAVPRAGSVLDREERGQAVAVRDVEPARRELKPLDQLRVEGAHQALEAVGVVDLHTVHHGQVLVGAPAADRQSAVDVVDAGDARQGLKRAEDALGRPGQRLDLSRLDDERRGPRVPRGNLRADADRLVEARAWRRRRSLGRRLGPGLLHHEEAAARTGLGHEPVGREDLVEDETRRRGAGLDADAHRRSDQVAAEEDA
jgi:hypothetical protein